MGVCASMPLGTFSPFPERSPRGRAAVSPRRGGEGKACDRSGTTAKPAVPDTRCPWCQVRRRGASDWPCRGTWGQMAEPSAPPSHSISEETPPASWGAGVTTTGPSVQVRKLRHAATLQGSPLVWRPSRRGGVLWGPTWGLLVVGGDPHIAASFPGGRSHIPPSDGPSPGHQMPPYGASAGPGGGGGRETWETPSCGDVHGKQGATEISESDGGCITSGQCKWSRQPWDTCRRPAWAHSTPRGSPPRPGAVCSVLPCPAPSNC